MRSEGDELDEGVSKGGLTFRVEENTERGLTFRVEENTERAAFVAGSATRTKSLIILREEA
jgi:hypothetical protein